MTTATDRARPTLAGDSPTDSAPDEAPVVAVGEAEGTAAASGDGTSGPNEPLGAAVPAERRPGRQSGAPGFGRTQKLAVNAVLDHWPERCAACDGPFAAEPESQAYGGYDEIEVLPADANAPGLRLWVTQHRFREVPSGALTLVAISRRARWSCLNGKARGWMLSRCSGRAWLG